MKNIHNTNISGVGGAVRGLTAPYIGKTLLRMMLICSLTFVTSACGLKGNLYLPEKSSPVVITPASSSSSSSEASSSSAQAAP